MDEKELLKERFKSAVSSTVRAISENFNLDIQFGNKLNSYQSIIYKYYPKNMKQTVDCKHAYQYKKHILTKSKFHASLCFFK